MDFMNLPTRKRRFGVPNHVVILSVFAFTLIAFRLADDPDTGKAQVSDGVGFALVFAVSGYFLGWLPSLWQGGKRAWLEPVLLPTFLALIPSYLYLAFKAYYVQPGATGSVVVAHLVVLIYLAQRT